MYDAKKKTVLTLFRESWDICCCRKTLEKSLATTVTTTTTTSTTFRGKTFRQQQQQQQQRNWRSLVDNNNSNRHNNNKNKMSSFSILFSFFCPKSFHTKFLVRNSLTWHQTQSHKNVKRNIERPTFFSLLMYWYKCFT